jgi:hypothetical protein
MARIVFKHILSKSILWRQKASVQAHSDEEILLGYSSGI